MQTSNEKVNEITKPLLCNNTQYLGIYLIKDVQDLCTSEIPAEGMKKKKRGKIFMGQKCKIVKILPKLVLRFDNPGLISSRHV